MKQWLLSHKWLAITGTVIAFILAGLIAVANYPMAQVHSSAAPLAASDVNTVQLAQLTNQDRAASGVTPLAEDASLDQSAQAKCTDMAQNSYYSHVSPAGVQWSDFIKKYYPYYQLAGENIAAYYSADSATGVNSAWMNSPEHKANILNSDFTKVGYASCLGTYQNHPTVFVVEHFMQPYIPPAPVVQQSNCFQPSVSRNRYNCADARTYPPCVNGINPYDGTLYCI